MKYKTKFFNHFSWYFVGAMLPMLVNFIKTPIFTRHYSAEDYGYLGLVIITFGYITTVCYSWISNCIWQFYHKYKNDNKLDVLYSNLFFVYLLSTFLLFVAAFFSYQYFDSELAQKLVIIGALHFIFQQTISLLMIVVRLKNKSKQYNLFLIFQAIFSFLVLLILAFVFHLDISALFLSSLVIDIFSLCIILGLFIRTGNLRKISTSKFSLDVIKSFGKFGVIKLISNIFLLLIVSSDRYFIAHFNSIQEVGIYSKSYDVAYLSLLGIIYIFFGVINPRMNKELQEKKENANSTLTQYFKIFFLFGIPLTLLSVLFSEEITFILLGEEFQLGRIVMPYVFISMWIYGVIIFMENKFNFTEKIKLVLVLFGLSSGLNLILNYILIPKFGFHWAAITTLIAYFLILISMLFFDKFLILKSLKTAVIAKLTIFSAIVIIVHLYINHFQTNHLIQYSILECLGYFVFFLLFFYKEFRDLKIEVD